MRELLSTIFSTAPYVTPAQKDRAQMIYIITVLLFVAYGVFALFVPTRAFADLTLMELALVDRLAAFYLISFYIIGIVSIWSTRRGRIDVAGFGPIIMFAAASSPLGMLAGFVYGDQTILLVIMILTGGLLNRERGLLVATALALGVFFVGYQLRGSLDIRPETLPFLQNQLVLVPLQLLIASGITYLFLRSVRSNQLDVIVQATQERLRLAEISTQIARRISSRMALNPMLMDAVEQICVSYPQIYHAQIFLLNDERRAAQLVASTGEVGRMLLQRQHNLEVGSQSVIGQVTATGDPVIAYAGMPGSIHRPNIYLPDTSVEAAFPLRIGDVIIGALDLQSKVAGIFQRDDILIFQSLADNIAVAIDNARLFEETEQQLYENQRLVEQAREAVQEVERLNRRLTAQMWEAYLQTKDEPVSLSVDFAGHARRAEAELTPTLARALDTNRLVQETRDGAQVIAVPLRVRGQMIGAMEFELDNDAMLAPEDLTLTQQVGERFGLAMENLRLYEESQRIAQREARVNEIGTRLQASNNLEAVLAEAARSLKQTLNAGKVTIRLGTPAASGAHGNGEGL